ncbi:MAG: phosphoadenylyl-sulfate reductase [Acidimicrobiales bacterium]
MSQTDDTTVAPSAALRDELAAADAQLAHAAASKVIEWAVERFGRDLVLAASFQDVVLIDLAVRVDPGIEVVFCDTEAHFDETLAFVDQVTARYGLHLTVTRPGPEAATSPCGTEGCCALRKVAPLRQVLGDKEAWLTSLKRVDAATRANAPVVGWDDIFGVVKVNPLATWTDADVDGYLAAHDLPVHPLVEKGYLSIGCAPTTRPVGADEDPRAGRWAGTGKTECGLHAP